MVSSQRSCVHHSLKKWKLNFFAIRWEGSGSVHQPAGMGACFWNKACTSWETLSLLQPAAREGYVDFFSLWTVPINSFTGIPLLWKTFSFLWSSPSSCCVSQKTISKFEYVWVSMDTSIEPEWQGEFYITWIDIFILVKIKSLFQCPYYKESVNIFKLAFFSLKNHCVRRSTKVISIFCLMRTVIKETTFVKKSLWLSTCQPSKED